MKDSKKAFVSSTTKLAVLAMLTNKTKYGFQIIKELDAVTGGFFDLREGALYPVLHKLEKEGLLTGEWKFTRPGFSRRYYTITSMGKTALRLRKEQWTNMVRVVDAIVRRR
jgi:DNA-binding PadR family transcriptional regulator